MFKRARIGNWLFSFGILALFLAFMPYFHSEGGVTAPDQAMIDHLRVNPRDTPTKTEYRFGWSESPLIQYLSEQKLVPKPDGGYRVDRASGLSVYGMSWSTLTLVISAVLLGIASWMMREAGDSPVDTLPIMQKRT